MTQLKQTRGGSWRYGLKNCPSAFRNCHVSDNTSYYVGFRVVCNEKSPPPNKILRGGSWYLNPRYCRSACRSHFGPGNTYDSLGFRVVCSTPN